MDTAIGLSEQSTTTQLTSTSICESSAGDAELSPSRLEDGNGVASSSFNYNHSTTNGGTLPRSEGPQDTLSRSQKQGKSGKFGGDDVERRYKLCLRAEIVGLCIVIVIVWGLLLLPIVFYHLPVATVSVKPSVTRHVPRRSVWALYMWLQWVLINHTLTCT